MQYRYQGITKTRQKDYGITYYVNAIYPDVQLSDNDQYVITTIGDRLDLLAYDVYKDESLWWIISIANGLSGDSLYPPVGMQLRIPSDIQSTMTKFKAINIVR
jgi:hypothetical protein